MRANWMKMDEQAERTTFLVTIERVEGKNLISYSQNRPSTFVKVKFDEWCVQVTTDRIDNEESPVWNGFPYSFEYKTFFPKQNHLKLKKCRFEVWDKQPWSRACKFLRCLSASLAQP